MMSFDNTEIQEQEQERVTDGLYIKRSWDVGQSIVCSISTAI
jgi:hypothetical protein